MPGGLTLTNQQTPLGLGFPSPPVDPGMIYCFFIFQLTRVLQSSTEHLKRDGSLLEAKATGI
jgi:hypothetical protein